MTIGQSIINARESKGLSRKQLSIKSNISEHTIRSWEVDRSIPNVYLAIKIADVLNISLDSLVGRKYNEQL